MHPVLGAAVLTGGVAIDAFFAAVYVFIDIQCWQERAKPMDRFGVFLLLIFGVGFFSGVHYLLTAKNVDDPAGQWLDTALCGLTVALMLLRWWRTRKRKRRLAALGAKGKAKLEALVRKMRETSPGRLVPEPI